MNKDHLSKEEKELLARALKQMRNHFKGSLILKQSQISEGVNAVFALEKKLERLLGL